MTRTQFKHYTQMDREGRAERSQKKVQRCVRFSEIYVLEENTDSERERESARGICVMKWSRVCVWSLGVKEGENRLGASLVVDAYNDRWFMVARLRQFFIVFVTM